MAGVGCKRQHHPSVGFLNSDPPAGSECLEEFEKTFVQPLLK